MKDCEADAEQDCICKRLLHAYEGNGDGAGGAGGLADCKAQPTLLKGGGWGGREGGGKIGWVQFQYYLARKKGLGALTQSHLSQENHVFPE